MNKGKLLKSVQCADLADLQYWFDEFSNTEDETGNLVPVPVILEINCKTLLIELYEFPEKED